MANDSALELVTVVDAINRSWFGAALPRETQARLALLAHVDRRAGGTELLREGEPAESFAIVLSGRIALRMLVPERGMVTILTVEPGDVVGWSALVPPHRATSTAVAIEPVELLAFDGHALREALRTDCALSAAIYPRLIHAVGRRLTNTRLQLLDLFARDGFVRSEVAPW
jgi:CRP/FNR family cyclic AMP-dependent transcriptional regulator